MIVKAGQINFARLEKNTPKTFVFGVFFGYGSGILGSSYSVSESSDPESLTTSASRNSTV